MHWARRRVPAWAIKSQQMSASKERERIIQSIPVQDITVVRESDRRAASRRVMAGHGEDDVEMATAGFDET
ncbi:hypothetical protein HRG_014700 [Hirsutella rhossiliensis]